MAVLCPQCGRPNPGNRTYCLACGGALQHSRVLVEHRQDRFSFLQQLPSWSWLILGFFGIGAVILLVIGLIFAVGFIEGFASIVLLLAGAFAFGVFSKTPPFKLSPSGLALAIGFFALMGMAIDQTGNRLYNLPVNVLCPSGSSLNRTVDLSHPAPGRTDLTQKFTCVQADGHLLLQLDPLQIIGVRLAEYVLIGYLLVGLRQLLWRIRSPSPAQTDQG